MMRCLRLSFSLVGVCLLIEVAAAQEIPTQAKPPLDVILDAQSSFIFRFADDTPAVQVRQRAAALTNEAEGRLRHIFTTAIKGFSASMSAVAADKLINSNPNIIGMERNGVVTALPKPPWAGGGTGEGSLSGQVTPWGVKRVVGTSSDGSTNLQDGSGKTAWVIDTGIDLNHPDLIVDINRSQNFVLKGKNSPDDGNGHGTHVAGTIAALNNDIDVVGVAAGATVVAVRVLDNSGSGTVDGVVAGIDYVAQMAVPGDVANMSLGARGHFSSLHDAIHSAAENGIIFSIAAGNSGDDAMKYEPAHVEHPNVFTVSAVNDKDGLASWSNFCNGPVDFAGPGVDILSTKKGGGTTTMSGTSMAAPHVAGLALLFGTGIGADGVAKNDTDPGCGTRSAADPIAHK